jgi:hypothetical protein
MSYYEKSNGFGNIVSVEFPDSSDDISEAFNCFALDRHTACVMHCMRAIEPAISALANKIGVKYDNTNLGDAMKIIRQRISDIDSGKSPQPTNWRSLKKYYEEAMPELGAIKDAWRNYVMHGKESYGEEKSLNIMNHTKRFMEHVASKIQLQPPQ